MRKTIWLVVFTFAPVCAMADLSQPLAPPVLHLAQLATLEESGPALDAAFKDDFDGEALGAHWELLRRDEEGFIVDNGELLIATGEKGWLSDESMKNVFKLNRSLPTGDWVATLRVKLDAQTGKEGFLFVLYDDKDNFVGLEVFTELKCCYKAVLTGSAFKRQKGIPTEFRRRIWTGNKQASQVFSASAAGMPTLQLRLQKRRRSYYPAIKLEEKEGTDWIELERLAALRAKGRLAFALYQYDDTKGETIATVDWVSVEKTD